MTAGATETELDRGKRGRSRESVAHVTRIPTHCSGSVSDAKSGSSRDEKLQAGPTGATLNVGTYDAYGVTTAPSSWRFQYTGQTAIQQVGLYYYKARFYNPVLGRFMQTDPIGYEDDYNSYAYVGNDPVNRSDPTGLYEVGCGANDQACKDAAAEFEKQRQKNLKSKDSKIAASAAAYGNPGADNGVTVNFLSDDAMDEKYDKNTLGSASGSPGGHIDVDIRGSLKDRRMQGVSAHEGVHVKQRQDLAASYDLKTGTWSSQLNLTKLDRERAAYQVENRITGRFANGSEIDAHIRANYDDLGNLLVPASARFR